MKFLVSALSIFLLLNISGCTDNKISVCKDDRETNWYSDRHKSYITCRNFENTQIFKDPQAALKQIQIDYPQAFEAVEKQFDLKPISHKTVKDYFVYSWQLQSDDEELLKQAQDITEFFGTYRNSYVKIKR